MNKKLLIHIGYPKTGTTTVQEEIFVKLHELGKINYLGRTVKSSHTRTGKSKFDGVDWVSQIRKNFILNEALKDDNHVLKSNILNVLSDEDMTFHGFFHYSQFGNLIDHNSFPDKLKNLIGDNVQVTILITLRNQADLIFSSYVQKFRFLKSHFGDYSLDAFLNNSSKYMDRNVKDHLSLYDFGNNIDRWEKTFNTKVRILFFEDFVHQKDVFFKQLFDILKMPDLNLSDFEVHKEYRKRDKSKETIKSGYWSLSPFGKMTGMILNERDFKMILERRYHMRSSLYLNFEKKLLMKFNRLEIPNIKSEQRKIVMDYFSDSNRKFAENRGIDLQKMKKYGYL